MLMPSDRTDTDSTASGGVDPLDDSAAESHSGVKSEGRCGRCTSTPLEAVRYADARSSPSSPVEEVFHATGVRRCTDKGEGSGHMGAIPEQGRAARPQVWRSVPRSG